MRKKNSGIKFTSMVLAATIFFGMGVPMEAHAGEERNISKMKRGDLIYEGDTGHGGSCGSASNNQVGFYVDFVDAEGKAGIKGRDLSNGPMWNYEDAEGTNKAPIPKGKKFSAWKVKEGEQCKSSACPLRQTPHFFKVTVEPLFKISDEPEIDESTPVKDESAIRETEAYKEWAWSHSNDNPDNYLAKVKDSTGKELVSSVPTHTSSKDGSGLIVTQKSEEAEKAFGKSDAANQIVLHMNISDCGEEMRKLLESNAAAMGGKIQAIYDIKAEERTKKDYKAVRDIGSVATPVTYALMTPESMDGLSDKTTSILQYSGDGNITLLEDKDTDPKTITFDTKNPSGIFAIIVK